MVFPICTLDHKTGEHAKFQFDWAISFRDINISIIEFQAPQQVELEPYNLTAICVNGCGLVTFEVS